MIAPEFDFASDFAEGLAAVLVGQKWGYVNATGKLVIPPQFDYAADFAEGLAAVKLGDKTGFIDTNGQQQILPQFQNAGAFSEGWAWVQVETPAGSRWRYIDKAGAFLKLTPS